MLSGANPLEGQSIAEEVRSEFAYHQSSSTFLPPAQHKPVKAWDVLHRLPKSSAIHTLVQAPLRDWGHNVLRKILLQAFL